MNDVRISCKGDQDQLGFITLPTEVLPLLGRYLGFATQLLFIKRESIVMLQNSKDCWSVQCRKHCCYGNQSCIIFCVSIIKTNIYICALLL